jgi:UDP:flavonoid glycosyltransferase YjiC (YdhE family)
MLRVLRKRLNACLLGWSHRLYGLSDSVRLKRRHLRLLVFFHGYSLAHTIRPLVLARALRQRGYRVEFAGAGPHQERVRAEGFPVHEIETMPQSRMDEYVARGDYAYYDLEWIGRCVRAERDLVRTLRPDLLIADMRPTLRLTAALEGTDLALVEAGYNQPGYPFPIPLPASFSTSSGPFDEYLKQQGSSAVRPHHLLYLVADVPEFHPAGPHTPSYYRYVGPLIETDLPEPDAIPALADEGWDASLPLIYLNCGSTGAPPAFLQAVLAALAQTPYRVLVTTAGRWSGTAPSPHIRLVDFLPAAWAMPRAALFVGLGGIGSIYHALRQGVPIIGAPEHLDQEYHLNRVRDLGLGLKLNWEDFHQASCLLEAVQSLFARYEEFARQCRTFSQHVQQWQGGNVAAEVIDHYFISRQSAYQIAPEYLISAAEFIHQLDLSTPADFGPEAIQHLLRQDIHRGLPHFKRGSQLSFDQRDSWNWLYDHEPRFFESDYQALERKRRVFFAQEGDRLVPRRRAQRYRLTYRYRIYPSPLLPGRPARLFLPYPIATAYQQDLRLCSCRPESLQEYLLPQAGFFYNYPLNAKAQKTFPLEFTYTCEATVKAQSLKEAPQEQTLSPREHRRFTEVDPELGASAVVRGFVQQAGLEQGQPAEEKARRIYLHLARTKRFKKTRERCQCLGCSTELILSDTGGHCITLAQTFIALCRLEGIPARAVTGALAGYPAGENRFVMGAYNENLLGHTWAEVFLPEYGWIPVEFHSIAISRTALTTDNVADAALRQHILAQSDQYLDYYFGNLDCHRVVCSGSVKQIPHVLVQEDTNGGPPILSPPPDLRYECHLEFECV